MMPEVVTFKVDVINVLIMLAAWLTLVIQIAWKRKKDKDTISAKIDAKFELLARQRQEFSDKISEKMAEFSEQTARDHNAVRAQISDLGMTVRENYISKSEAASLISNLKDDLRNGVAVLREDFRVMSQRVDRMIGGSRGPNSSN